MSEPDAFTNGERCFWTLKPLAACMRECNGGCNNSDPKSEVVLYFSTVVENVEPAAPAEVAE